MAIGHREDLRGLFVEQKMVISEVRATHVPVKVLRLQVKRERIGKQSVERSRNFLNRCGLEVGRGVEIGRDFVALVVIPVVILGFAHVIPSC